MRSRTFFPGLTLLVAAAACNAGPEPRDASHTAPMPIPNTAAQVMNEHAVTDIQVSAPVEAVLAQPDRSPEDRALDTPRQSAELLSFLNVTPGMRVVDLTSGGGYVTELLGRSVGASGVVYGNNPPSLVTRAGFGDSWSARLRRPANARVVRLALELGAPLPAEVRGVDLVYLGFFYRDLPSIGVDRRLLLASALGALRPGGRLVVFDRATPQGKVTLDLHAMHTEESRNARYEIERAGFHFVSEGRFLRSSTLESDWNRVASDAPTPLETQDRFVLAFVK